MDRTWDSVVKGEAGAPQGPRGGTVLRGRAAAFTMIELMVVIMIIGLLVGMLLPTVSRVRIKALVSASLSDIAILDRGCQLYYDDNKKQYPPSDVGLGNSGGQRLVGYLVASGKAYGCEYVPTVKPENGTQKSFADRLGNPILYYRFDRDQGKYHKDDNPSDNKGISGPADIDVYARYLAGDGSQRYYRTDFLLMSCGADGRFVDPDDDETTDDITNFLSQ